MKTYHSFVLIRMVVGFGFGIVTSLVIVHVSEISPPQFRAYSIALNVFMWSVSNFVNEILERLSNLVMYLVTCLLGV